MSRRLLSYKLFFFSIQDDGDHAKFSLGISSIKTQRTPDLTIVFIPMAVMKNAVFVTIFKQFHQKSRIFENLGKSFVIIYDLVCIGGMTRISVPAYFYHILIPFIPKILVRDCYAQIATVGKIIIAIFRRVTPS